MACLLSAGDARSAPVHSPDPAGVNQGDYAPVTFAQDTLDAFHADARRLLAASADQPVQLKPVNATHLLAVGADLATGEDNVLRALGALAENHGLVVEEAIAENRVVLVVGYPIPTLRFSWQSHPFEKGYLPAGCWERPFADLSDVEAIQGKGDRRALTLKPDAVRRIDRQSVVHGHRQFVIQAPGLRLHRARVFTWLPGLQSIPDVPAEIAVAGEGGDDPHVSLQALLVQFEARVAARTAAASILDISAEWIGKAPMEAPPVGAPLFLWAIADQTADGGPACDVPWIQTGEDSRRWLALRDGGDGANWVRLGPAWALDAAGSPGTLNVAMVPGSSREPDASVARFLQSHVGARVGVLLEGQVIGVAVVDHARATQLVLQPEDGRVVTAALARWGEAYGDPAETAVASDPSGDGDGEMAPVEDDFFQVRLMAEPQDRELIPVTHFAAPGAAKGVLVAVQNDIILDSRAVTDAHLEEEADRLYISLSLTDAGRNALADACFTHLGKQLAIVFEDELLCAPTIMDWEQDELRFKGLNEDWPKVAVALAERLRGS